MPRWTQPWCSVCTRDGRKVNCWTVDAPEEARRLVAMGVDYITSNILEGGD